MYLFICLFVYFCISSPFHSFICLSVCEYIYNDMCLSIHFNLFQFSLLVFACLFVCLYVYVCFILFVCLFVCLSVRSFVFACVVLRVLLRRM